MTAHHLLQKGLFVFAARSPAGDELYQKGNASYANHNIVEALCLWSEAVESYHHPEACMALGRCYDFGEGTKADQSRAFDLYKQAAKLGCAAGMYNVGGCLRLGAGVEKNDKKALKYFLRAHKRGHANASVSIGSMYLKGDGVKRNARKAVKYFRIGVQHDIPAAQYTLGLLYLTDDNEDLELMLEREREHVTEIEKEKTRSKTRTKLHNGIPVNKMEGLTLLHLAAAAGHAGAAQHLQELGILRPNVPKAAPVVSTPRLERGDAVNLIQQLHSTSDDVKVQAAKTLAFLIAGHKPNLDILVQDQLCTHVVHAFDNASMDLLEWLIAISESISQSDFDDHKQALAEAGALPALIACLEFEEIASRILSVVFMLVDQNRERKRALRALGMSLEVKEMSTGTCNMVIKHGSFAEDVLQRQRKRTIPSSS